MIPQILTQKEIEWLKFVISMSKKAGDLVDEIDRLAAPQKNLPKRMRDWVICIKLKLNRWIRESIYQLKWLAGFRWSQERDEYQPSPGGEKKWTKKK